MGFKDFYNQQKWEPETELWLPPAYIYDTYFLELYMSTMGTDKYKDTVIKEHLNKIKNMYLSVYKSLLSNQILKYISRGRIDSKFDLKKHPEELSYKDLVKYISLTFRSDMTRLNKRWISLAEHLMLLDKARDVDDIIKNLDRINNLTHNTTTLMLDKFSNANELLQALDAAANVKNINELQRKISRNLKKDLIFENKEDEVV